MLNSANADGIVHRGRWLLGLVTAIAALLALGLASNAHAGPPPEETVQVCTLSDSTNPCNPCDISNVADSGDYCNPCEINDAGDRTLEDAELAGLCKTAYPKWEQKTEWRVRKGVLDKDKNGNRTFVDEQRIKLFYGDAYWANYGVSLMKRVTDTYSVHGKIYIPLGHFGKEGVQERGVVTIKDVISSPDYDVPVFPTITGDSEACKNSAPGGGSGGGSVDYVGTIVCDYWAEIPAGTPLAEAGVNKVELWIGDYGPYEAYAPYTFPDGTTHEVGHKKVYLQDNNFDRAPIAFETGKRFTYKSPREFTCNKDMNPYEHVNTVRILVPNPDYDTIVDDNKYKMIGSASATVGIKCYGLDVKKTVKKAKFDRTYKWDIKKYASHKQVVLARKKGDSKKGSSYLSKYAKEANVKYTVKVDSYPEDHDFKSWGKIVITNDHPGRAAHILSVKDKIDPGGNKIIANVRCEGEKKGEKIKFPLYLDAGATLTCYWKASLPDNAERRNVARVKIQNYHYEVVKNDYGRWGVKRTGDRKNDVQGR